MDNQSLEINTKYGGNLYVKGFDSDGEVEIVSTTHESSQIYITKKQVQELVNFLQNQIDNF